MIGSFSDPDSLILLAGGTYIVGYLIINQVMFRLLLLLGTMFYIGYYATVAEAPLMAAIYTSVIMAVANIIGLGVLMMRRTALSIPREFRGLYSQFSHMAPGDFGLLVRACRRRITTEAETLAHQGQTVTQIVYLVRAKAQVDKSGAVFSLPDGVFVGEVAYLLSRPAAATTTVEAGAELLIWERSVIEARARRNPRFQLALEAAISHDMARKVALAVAPGQQRQGAAE